MIQQAQIQQIILSKLEDYTACICVPANTTKKMPPYPYISFNVINTDVKKGTYGAVEEENKRYLFKELSQTWSFTVQSDDNEQALALAMLISDFFEESKRQELEDNNIVVADVGAITPRDNMLTIEYEYRKGLDVKLRLNNVIESTVDNEIDKINIGNINLEKE